MINTNILIALLLIHSTLNSSPSIQEMASLLVNGIQSKIYDLHTKDNPSIDMDCLKVLYGMQVPIGVFHSGNPVTHYSSLYYAEQRGQENWSNQLKLSTRGSQGTLFFIGNYILVSYELENHENGNTLAIRFYESLSMLRKNIFLYEYQLNQLINNNKVRNIGTPSLQTITTTKNHTDPKYNQYNLNIKFHYSPDGQHDLPGQGFVNLVPLRDFVNKEGEWVGGCKENYEDWKGFADTTVLQVMKQSGCEGKIGQRDLFTINKKTFYLYQCNLFYQFNWKNWRIFIYSPEEKKAQPLSLELDQVIDIANPHISLVKQAQGNYEYLLTFFLPSEGISPSTVAKPGQVFIKSSFMLK